MKRSIVKNVTPISSTTQNSQEFLNFCMKYFVPTSDFITVIIPDKQKISFYCLAKIDAIKYRVTYFCQSTNVPLDKRIFWNFENHQIIVLFEQNGYDRTLLPGILKCRIKFKEFYKFDHPFFSQFHGVKWRKAFEDLRYPFYPLPIFEYHIQDLSNFEAMIYLILNESKLFMGQKIAILIPKNFHIYVYIFRRILLHFLLESNLVFSIKKNITEAALYFPQQIMAAIFMPFPQLKIVVPFNQIQNSAKNIRQGEKFYLKAEKETALGIYSTQNYLKVLKEAKEKYLLGSVYFEPSSPLSSATIPIKRREKVIIQIQKDETIRICVAKKKGSDFEIISSYPDDNEFIPLYISFFQRNPIIGNAAIKDYNIHPEYVIFDIFKVAGKPLSNLPSINTQWGFQLVPIENSQNSKLGFKVNTFNGIQIFPTEIVLSLIFKYFLERFKSYLSKEEGFLVHFIDKKLTIAQQNILWEVGKLLGYPLKIESHINLGNRLIKKRPFQKKSISKFGSLTEECI